MAQDIRKLFEDDQKLSKERMPQGHEARFLKRLDEALPEAEDNTSGFRFNFMKIAASMVIFLGLAYGAVTFFGDEKPPVKGTNPDGIVTKPSEKEEPEMKSLRDVSPDLKKIEDYYLANINFELSKIKLTPENKELFDSYVERLDELNEEYQLLSKELTEDGPNERTVDALINNLKLRLNLLYRLKEQLKSLNDSEMNPVSS
ncbi:hypothetical protein [Winogradskyella sp. 3972H.M.0a.05]|uniref:hypothetical protein n=1 Tax=Winogradskyella sp. 3972H.M.0a.05 TaxID=2950277 RepID=UPI0033987E29